MQLRSGTTVSLKESILSKKSSPKQTIVSTMRLRSGRTLENKSEMKAELPMPMPKPNTSNVISPKESILQSKRSPPMHTIVSTMRLRSGHILGYKSDMNAELPFTDPNTGVLLNDTKTNDIVFVIYNLIKNISAVNTGSNEKNIIKRTIYVESLFYHISRNIDFMLSSSRWSKFVEITIPKMLQLSSEIQKYLNSPSHSFSYNERKYLTEMSHLLTKFSVTVQTKLSAKK